MTWKGWKPCAFSRKTFAKLLRRPGSEPPDCFFLSLILEWNRLPDRLDRLPNDPNPVVDLVTDHQIPK